MEVRQPQRNSVLTNIAIVESATQRPLSRSTALPAELGQRLDNRLTDYWSFLRSFLRSPGSVGSIAPSSRSLAEAMIAGTNLDKAQMVVELGPGTGAITQTIISSIGRNSSFLAMELDARAVQRLRQRFPDVNICHDSAEKIRSHLGRYGRRHADVIVCSIPWAVMPQEVQRTIMQHVAAALAPDGVFTACTYIGAPLTARGRHYGHLLRNLFSTVEVSKMIWGNVPPALVYRCRRPLRPPEQTRRPGSGRNGSPRR